MGKLSDISTFKKEELEGLNEDSMKRFAEIKSFSQYIINTIPACKSLQGGQSLKVLVSGVLATGYFNEINSSLKRQHYYNYFEKKNDTSAKNTDDGKKILSLISEAIMGMDNGEYILSNMGSSDQLGLSKTGDYIINFGKTGGRTDIKKEDFNKLIKMGLIKEIIAGSPTSIVYTPKVSFLP
jgi:hypothetical protein